MGFGGYVFPVIIIALGLLFMINKLNIENDKKIPLYDNVVFFVFFNPFGYKKNQSAITFTKSITKTLELSKKG